MIAGVAAGLADRFGMDRGMMRLLFVLSLILPGPQILIYIVLWVIIPEEG
jgi:phage shock protein PspC (stress-responsive transcriptional regulator)